MKDFTKLWVEITVLWCKTLFAIVFPFVIGMIPFILVALTQNGVWFFLLILSLPAAVSAVLILWNTAFLNKFLFK